MNVLLVSDKKNKKKSLSFHGSCQFVLHVVAERNDRYTWLSVIHVVIKILKRNHSSLQYIDVANTFHFNLKIIYY